MSPFDDESLTFVVTKNAHGHYALWPARLPLPSGWSAHTNGVSRQKALDVIEQHWTDFRPTTYVS